MSGGSYDYAYSRVEDLAERIQATTPLRKAFKTLLLKVAEACHDIEWVDSGDYGYGDEDEAIRKCFGANVDAFVLNELIADAKKLNAELSQAILNAEGKQ